MTVSCEKKSEPEFQQKNGIVLNYGSPAADGWGWMIEMNKIVYSPVNLDSNFLHDSLKVIVYYQILNSTFTCGWRTPGFQQINIISIKKP